MTYFQFHLLFNLPLLVGLTVLNWANPWDRGEVIALGVVAGVVMVFTSPWDNWAVKRGIWDFPPSRVWRRIGYLPVEEYLFFIGQTVNIILFVRWLLASHAQLRTSLETPLGPTQGVSVLLVLLTWLGVGWKWKWRPSRNQQWYAWHLLFWFLPVIFLQWALAPYLFCHLSGVLLGVTLLFGTYYVLADLMAVRQGIWYFDGRQITGWKLFGVLPWEEMAFFYLTSLLVAQSYLLLLPAALR